MLKLRRKPGETVKIAGVITVRVGRITRRDVELLFDAAREIKILRGELDEVPLPPEPASVLGAAAAEKLTRLV